MKISTAIILFSIVLSSCSNGQKTADSRMSVNDSELREIVKDKEYTLIYFWTTWCGPCRKTLSQTLPAVEKSLDPKKVQLVVVAVSKDREKVNQVIGKTSLSSPNYQLDFTGPDMYFTHKMALKSTLEDLFPKDKVWKNGVPVFILVDKNMKVLNNNLSTKLPQLKKSLKSVML